MRRGAAIAVSVLLAGCARLIDLDFGRCGNGLVEPELGEKCDNAVDSTLGDGLVCGPPGVPSQACQYVCGATNAACPRGWVCGADDVCKHAISELEPTFSVPLGEEVVSIQSGDFDGDGHPDLLWSTRAAARVEYNDGRGFFAEGLDIPLPHSFEPALADLDEDGRTDITIAFADQPMVLVGRSDRQMVPAGIASGFEEAFGVPDIGASGVEFVVDANYSAVYFRVPGGVALGSEGQVEPLPDEAGATPGLLVLGSLPTATIAMAFPGATDLLLIAEPGTRVTRVPMPRALMGGLAEIDGELFVQVANDDEDYADAVVRVGPAPGGGHLVSEAALFDPCIPSICAGGMPCVECQQPPPDGPKIVLFPLAAGDFDEDGRTDVLTPLGFLLRRGADGWAPGEGRIGEDDLFATGTVRDLNRDGHLDVVTTSVEFPRLEVRMGVGNGAFVTTPIALRTKPKKILVADFDGDQVDEDIAFIEPTPTGDLLTVLYNDTPLFKTRRFPVMGRVEEATTFAPPNDNAFVVLTVAPEGETPRGAVVFEGSTYQLMLSVLPTPAAERGDTLVYVGTPQFDALDTSILGAWNGELGPWIWAREGGLRFVRREIQLEGTDCPSREDQQCLSAINAPIERDSGDETLVMVVDDSCVDDPRIIRADRIAGEVRCIDQAIEPFQDSILQGRIADLDGEGPFELLLLTNSELRIYWDLSLEGGVTRIPMAAEDFAVLNIDEDPEAELITVLGAEAQLHDVAERSLTLKKRITVVGAPDAERLARLLTDDFTGDGLEDLMIAHGKRYTLFRSLSSRERP